jgi:DUF1009 family protein
VNGSAGGASDVAAAPLAILCGSGNFPIEVATEVRRTGRALFLIGIVGSTDAAIEAFPHVWLRLGEVGKLFAALKERNIGEMVMIGSMVRPEFADLRLDWGAVKRAAELAQLFRRGDNGLLVGLAAIFEREGVGIVGAHEVAPRLAAPQALLGAWPVSPDDRADIALGARLLEALSEFDAGQSAVVATGRALAVEAAEGTDATLARVAELRSSGRLRHKGLAGVLVKAPKRGQDLRLDMPAVGPQTIEAAAKAQLRGVALAAGRVLVLERERCARVADAAGLFLLGFET